MYTVTLPETFTLKESHGFMYHQHVSHFIILYRLSPLCISFYHHESSTIYHTSHSCMTIYFHAQLMYHISLVCSISHIHISPPCMTYHISSITFIHHLICPMNASPIMHTLLPSCITYMYHQYAQPIRTFMHRLMCHLLSYITNRSRKVNSMLQTYSDDGNTLTGIKFHHESG